MKFDPLKHKLTSQGTPWLIGKHRVPISLPKGTSNSPQALALYEASLPKFQPVAPVNASARAEEEQKRIAESFKKAQELVKENQRLVAEAEKEKQAFLEQPSTSSPATTQDDVMAEIMRQYEASKAALAEAQARLAAYEGKQPALPHPERPVQKPDTDEIIFTHFDKKTKQYETKTYSLTRLMNELEPIARNRSAKLDVRTEADGTRLMTITARLDSYNNRLFELNLSAPLEVIRRHAVQAISASKPDLSEEMLFTDPEPGHITHYMRR